MNDTQKELKRKDFIKRSVGRALDAVNTAKHMSGFDKRVVQAESLLCDLYAELIDKVEVLRKQQQKEEATT